MEIKNLIENLEIPKEKIKYNEKMSEHTTFKIGGPAQCFIQIDNIQDLKKVLNFAKKNNIKITVIGNGSNILVSDNGIKGITLQIKLEKIDIYKENNKYKITVASGEKIGKIAQICLKNEISGLEELSGIPGTIGRSYKDECGCTWKRNKRHNKKREMYRL